MTQPEAREHVLAFLAAAGEEWKTSSSVDWHLISIPDGNRSVGTTDAALYSLHADGLVEQRYIPGYDMVTARHTHVPGWRLIERPVASPQPARPRGRLRLSPLAA